MPQQATPKNRFILIETLYSLHAWEEEEEEEVYKSPDQMTAVAMLKNNCSLYFHTNTNNSMHS